MLELTRGFGGWWGEDEYRGDSRGPFVAGFVGFRQICENESNDESIERRAHRRRRGSPEDCERDGKVFEVLVFLCCISSCVCVHISALYMCISLSIFPASHVLNLLLYITKASRRTSRHFL